MYRIIALAALSLWPTIAAAQCAGLSFWDTLSDPQQAEAEARADAIPYGRGNLWTAKRGEDTLWVIGTMHLPDNRHGETMVEVLPFFDRADILLVEATLDDQADMQGFMAQNPDLMTLPQGMSLPQELDATTWEAIADAAAARGVPGFMAARMQPWFLSLTLSIPPCAMSGMVSGQGGLDTMLMQMAEGYAVPVAALEPWQDMFGLMSSGTFEEQLNALRLALVDPWLQDALTVGLTDLYFEGESAKAWFMTDYLFDYLDGIDRATFEAQLAEMEDLLLNTRNRNWIPVINTAATQHDAIIVAFGAAHLFGKVGLLNLLETDGWAITAGLLP